MTPTCHDCHDVWGVHTFKRRTDSLLSGIVDKNHVRASAFAVYNYLSNTTAHFDKEQFLATGSHITINGYTFVVSRANEVSDVYEITLTQAGKIMTYYTITTLKNGLDNFAVSVVNADKWDVISNQNITFNDDNVAALGYDAVSAVFDINATQKTSYLNVIR
jgi:hypothetical protein